MSSHFSSLLGVLFQLYITESAVIRRDDIASEESTINKLNSELDDLDGEKSNRMDLTIVIGVPVVFIMALLLSVFYDFYEARCICLRTVIVSVLDCFKLTASNE